MSFPIPGKIVFTLRRDRGLDSIQRCRFTIMGNLTVQIWRWYDRLICTIGFPIGRTVPVTETTQSPQCYLVAVDHAKIPPPPPPTHGHLASSSNFIFQHNTWSKYIKTNLTNEAYPGYCKHVLCWRPPEKAWAYLAGGNKPGLYRANRATQSLLFSSPLILLRCVTEIKFAQNLALTWKLTLKLEFPAHFISN